MSLETELRVRAGDVCEICGNADGLLPMDVDGGTGNQIEQAILACETCATQIRVESPLDPKHLLCLNDSAWSQEPAVQVTAWRLLNQLPEETWARDLLDMLYLDDETLAWAKAGVTKSADDDDAAIVHKDTYGAVLNGGDTVTLIKDIKVKGAGFTAKRGTAVRNISLVHDNAQQIEGRVNDQRIVILTEFVKKS
ncbi:alkylphosphonate utilization protein [uncultured Roseibium sp.]|uniref:PhnA domain-containing protein n=1 Tax=uncultured Roseibium sp. TaxID=1936171 RepID=UPI002599C21F|nr:alkylphosphonate utilization protein [uncultured Roseibium sp.]